MPHTDPVAKAEYFRAYRERNREKLVAMGKLYREANASRLAERKHEDYLQNMDAYKRRAKEHRERNADKLKAARSAPEYKARRRALRRAAYVPKPKPEPKTREQILADKRAEYQRNRERYRATFQSYYQNNKDQWKEYHARKPWWMERFHHSLTKANSKGAEIVGKESLREFYRQVFTQDAAVCEYCRGQFPIREITVDHKHPYVLGGKHEVSNLTTSCLTCNLKKGEKPYELWIAK